MIKLDLGSLPEGSTHLDLTAEASDLGADPEGGRLESPVRVSLDVTRSGNDILLRGTAEVEARLECARCLEEYRLRLESPVELWVVLGGAQEDGEEQERENVIEVPAGVNWIDLAGYLRSELLVLIPLKALCKRDCRGLCPICGTNLNRASCSCHREDHDSRWDALKKIK